MKLSAKLSATTPFRTTLAIALLMMSLNLSSAQEQEQPSITTTGFVDFYFSKNFARPTSKSNKFRNFDIAENQFNLSLAEISFQRSASPVGFRIDADFGSANDIVQTGTTSTLNNLQQAYLTVVAPVGSGLTVDVGKFVTHMGFEVIESKDNWNYSRSLLFSFAIPYYHVGLRASYPVLNTLTLSGYAYNGWNNLTDNNGGKTLGATINFVPVSGLSVIANWIGGPEQVDSVSTLNRNVVDVIVRYQVNDQFSVAANGDYGNEKFPGSSVIWKGVALYGKYAFGGASAVALRGEVLSDPHGFMTGTIHDLKEVTLTLEHKVFRNLLLRAEYRHDWSNVKVFDNNTSANVLNHQNTIVVGSVISF